MAVSASTIRNVALLSHSGAGKTTLAENMLFNTKVINRIGRVEDGNTVSDHEPEENRRAASVQTSLIRFTEGDDKFNLLDTPGYDEFIGEAFAALRVVESAMILVAAPTGVDVGTERSWDLARGRNLPSPSCSIRWTGRTQALNVTFRRSKTFLGTSAFRSNYPSARPRISPVS